MNRRSMKADRLRLFVALGVLTCSAPLKTPSTVRTDGGGTRGPNSAGPVTTCPSHGVTEFPLPTVDSYPRGITAGPDGAIWFTEWQSNQIGRLAPDGSFQEFPVPTASAGPESITVGADGNLWFTEDGAGRIGRITPAGDFADFSMPTSTSTVSGIALGPDGNIWFAVAAGCLGRITPSGTVTRILTANSCQSPYAITAGPDGNLWFTVDTYVARISPEYPPSTFTPSDLVAATTPDPPSSCPTTEITAGADGNLWFGESPCSKIGRVTPTGELTEFTLPSGITGIASGPDGNIWFSESLRNTIACLIP